MARTVSMSNGPRRLHVVLHGKLSAHVPFREAVSEVRSWGHQVQVDVTWEAGDARRLAQQAVAAGADAVVAAGGDGTVNEVLQGLCSAGLPTRCPLGVVPLGTANDFATGVGLPLGDPLAALRLIAEGPAQWIDVGRVNDRYFLNVVSGGPATQFTRETPEGVKAWLGAAAYVLTGMAMLPALEPVPVQLRAPDWEWRGKVLVFAVGNGRQAGGGVPLCAAASLTDGLLDLLVMPESDENDLIGLFTNMLRLHLPNHGINVIYRKIPWLELATPQALVVNVDGEPMSSSRFRWEVFAGQLGCFIP